MTQTVWVSLTLYIFLISLIAIQLLSIMSCFDAVWHLQFQKSFHWLVKSKLGKKSVFKSYLFFCNVEFLVL